MLLLPASEEINTRVAKHPALTSNPRNGNDLIMVIPIICIYLIQRSLNIILLNLKDLETFISCSLMFFHFDDHLGARGGTGCL